MGSVNNSVIQPRDSEQTGWQADLQLEFARQESTSRTILARRKHHGPLLIQKPFYPEDETCHVYLIHPPAGIVGGDTLQLDVITHSDSHALITTPAATKFYRSSGKQAFLDQKLLVKRNSVLEWLPQESIFFNACQANMQTHVQLEENSSFTGWEILCLGRPASKDYFNQGSSRQVFEIWREETPLFIERSLFKGGDELLQAAWGMQSCTITATMISTDIPLEKELYDTLRAVEPKQGIAGISQFEYGMVARYLGNNAIAAREYFTRLWEIIRPVQIRKTSCLPRIWAT